MEVGRIKNIAQQLLGDGYSIPVDIIKIAKINNIRLVTDDLSSSMLSGFTYQQGEEKVIGVSKFDGKERQRFTIAHELGHLFLHKKMVNYDQGGVMMFRDGHSSDGTDLKEIQANRFAAEILMPEPDIRKDLAEVKTLDLLTDSGQLDSFVAKLAEKYEVSRQAMMIRLTSLYFG